MNPLKFVPVAEAIAGLSKDPSTRVGAIVLDDDSNILSVGFNGFPRGVRDDEDRYATKDSKYPRIAHAEMNAIAQAARVGAKLLGGTMIVTALYPCSMCTRLIIQAGIKKVYAPAMDPIQTNPLWMKEAEIAFSMFVEAGVEVITYNQGENHVS